MRMILKPFGLAAALALAGLVACTTGNDAAQAPAPVPAAKALAYTDPATGGWRLVKDASSTPTRLVLNLVGPAGERTRGVGFNLKAAAGAKFGTFPGGLPIQDAGVYQLRAFGSENPTEPVALAGGLKSGNLLSVGIYQKDRDQPAQDSGVALCRIAVTLDAAAGVKAGTALPLSVLKAKAIPEDIGAFTDDLWTLDRKMRMADITIAAGTLIAQ